MLALASGPKLMAQNQPIIAKDFIDKVSDEKYEDARKYLETKYKAKMHPVALHDFWDNLQKQAGSFKSLGQPLLKDTLGGKLVSYTATFSNHPMYLNFYFNAQDQIYNIVTKMVPIGNAAKQGQTGAGTQTAMSSASYTNLPGYANTGTFTEQDIEFKSGQYTIPGSLTLPKTGSKWPLVLLIQDQGPLDRDGTLGPNKPMRDIAFGLAQNGIASLRWDKRGLVYKDDLGQHGVELSAQTEVVEDAIAAIYYARTLDNIDKSNIYLAGYDMGGFLTPMIAQHAPYLAGMILINANAFPYDIALHNAQQFMSQHKNDPDSAEELAALDVKLRGVRKDTFPAGTPAKDLPGNLTLPFWKDIRNYSPAYTAVNIQMPILIMQGTRDVEVLNEDLAQWKTTMRRRHDVRIKTYPVNHKLQEGATDVGFPAEYMKPYHVPFEIIADMTTWIKKKT
jgi:hypothetical protein